MRQLFDKLVAKTKIAKKTPVLSIFLASTLRCFCSTCNMIYENWFINQFALWCLFVEWDLCLLIILAPSIIFGTTLLSEPFIFFSLISWSCSWSVVIPHWLFDQSLSWHWQKLKPIQGLVKIQNDASGRQQDADLFPLWENKFFTHLSKGFNWQIINV